MKRSAALAILLLLVSAGLARVQLAKSAPRQAPAETELIAHWKFDEGSGSTANDSSGNGYHGAISNGTWSSDVPPVSGADNYSLAFNGSSSFVDTAVFPINNEWSIAVWLKIEADGSRAVIGKHLDNGANRILFGIYSGGYHLNLYDGNNTGGPPVLNKWHHMLLVGRPQGTGTAVTLYRDGIAQWTFQHTAQAGGIDHGKPWTIGRDWDSDTVSNDYFQGKMADLRIYDRALNESEIATLTGNLAQSCDVPGDKANVDDAVADQECLIINAAAGEHPVNYHTPAHGFILRGAGREESVLSIQRLQPNFLKINSHVAIEQLTIRDGYSQDDDIDGGALNNQAEGALTLDQVALINNITPYSGGAIYNEGALTVRDSQFIENVCGGYDGDGGAIFNAQGATMTIERSLFLDNFLLLSTGGPVQHGGNGGAIHNLGQATISGSTITSNDAGNGGGIYNRGTLAVSGSAVDDNQAFNQSGGIANFGELDLVNSSVSGNTAIRLGGGILNYKVGTAMITGSTIANNTLTNFNRQGSAIDNWGEMTIINSTVSGNDIPNAPPQDTYQNAAIQQHWYPSSLTLIQTTVADNAPGSASNIYGVWVTMGNVTIYNSLLARNGLKNCVITTSNLIETSGNMTDDGCFGLGQSTQLDLGPLADNGGPTLTHALGASSEARDAGDPAFCEPVDQRGVGRGRSCDAGAYEFANLNLYLPMILNP